MLTVLPPRSWGNEGPPVKAERTASARESGVLLSWIAGAHALTMFAMHELALMESVVVAIGEVVGEEVAVTTVRLEVGRLSAVVPEALRFCFDVCTRGTALEGARLEIIDVPGRARCTACSAEVAIEHLGAACPCGGLELYVVAGEELRLRNVEVA